MNCVTHHLHLSATHPPLHQWKQETLQGRKTIRTSSELLSTEPGPQPTSSCLLLYNPLEMEPLYLEGEKYVRSSNVPVEAFFGDVGHIGEFILPQALAPLALQAQKTHKEEVHFLGTDPREPSSRRDVNMVMTMRRASITWNGIVHRQWILEAKLFTNGHVASVESTEEWLMGEATVALRGLCNYGSSIESQLRSHSMGSLPVPTLHPQYQSHANTPSLCSQNAQSSHSTGHSIQQSSLTTLIVCPATYHTPLKAGECIIPMISLSPAKQTVLCYWRH